MTTPLLRCAPPATPYERCRGINDEDLRRGTENGSPLSFLAQECRKQVIVRGREKSYRDPSRSEFASMRGRPWARPRLSIQQPDGGKPIATQIDFEFPILDAEIFEVSFQ